MSKINLCPRSFPPSVVTVSQVLQQAILITTSRLELSEPTVPSPKVWTFGCCQSILDRKWLNKSASGIRSLYFETFDRVLRKMQHWTHWTLDEKMCPNLTLQINVGKQHSMCDNKMVCSVSGLQCVSLTLMVSHKHRNLIVVHIHS